MLYCNLREAYDNNSGNGSKPVQQIPVNMSQSTLPLAPPNVMANMGTSSHSYGTRQNTGIRHRPEMHLPSNNGLILEDEMSSLNRSYRPHKVMFSDEDSEIIIPKRKNLRSHPYYIKKFLNSITDDDLMSLASNYDADMYQHIMSCKYCRMKIKYEMKKRFLNQAVLNTMNNNNNNQITGYSPITYQMQHFDPNLTLQPYQLQQLQQQQLQQQIQQQLPTLQQPLQQQQPIIEQEPIQKKVIEQQIIRNESNYEQYLLIFVVIILVIFLFADIVIKIIK
jgi:hypothetical protein